jgi:hypothetical protein
MIAIAQQSTPKTAEELTRVIERREELRGQLQSLNDQRAQLAEQVQRIGDPDVRSGPLARLKALDERLGRIEREVQGADEAIAQAKANGVSSEGTTVIRVPDVPPPAFPDFPQLPPSDFLSQQAIPWRERVLNSLEVTAPITLATVVLLGALLYWRISRSVKNQFSSLLAMQQSRLEEIQRSVDTVAVEIERVSENQRFVTKLVGERPAERAPHSSRITPH